MTDLPLYITPGTLGVVTTRDRIDEEDGGAIVGSFAPGNKNRGQPFFAVGETVILVGRPKPDQSKVIVAHMFGIPVVVDPTLQPGTWGFVDTDAYDLALDRWYATRNRLTLAEEELERARSEHRRAAERLREVAPHLFQEPR